MPSQITHILAGTAMIDQAGSRHSLLFSEHKGLFEFACQGPDIFYHNRSTVPSGIHFGGLLHRRRYGILVSSGIDMESELSFIIATGALCHAALDRALHPFIVYFSGRASPREQPGQGLNGCHPFLERLLDMYLHEKLTGKPVQAWDSGKMTELSSTERNALINFWEQGLIASCPVATAHDNKLRLRIENAISDSLQFYTWTNPSDPETRSGLLRYILALRTQERRSILSVTYPDTIPAKLDPGNEEGREWRHPAGTGGIFRTGALHLFKNGIADSVRMMNALIDFRDGKSSRATLTAAIGNDCLGCCDEDGHPAQVHYTNPLPLAKILDSMTEN